MINLIMQIKSIIFSFLYGIFISFLFNINSFLLFNRKTIIKIFCSIIFVIDSCAAAVALPQWECRFCYLLFFLPAGRLPESMDLNPILSRAKPRNI